LAAAPPQRANELDTLLRWPSITSNNADEQQHIIFDPIPRVDGIEVSADPLFEPRANIYLMSGRRRRAAEKHMTGH
jgi:catalase